MDELDERFVPRDLKLIVPACAVILFILFLAFGQVVPPAPPPDPPGPLLGCYSTPNGPDILVDRASLTVLQDPPLRIGSAVKFIKGWAFELNRWLDYEKRPDGKIRIVAGSTNGEFLQISREGEWASPISSFELFNRATGPAIRYSRSGDKCG